MKFAIIIGSGVGGLSAAAAIAPHFERVVILDKDRLPTQPQPRKSVAQGAHLHSLLLGGLDCLEELYPNFIKDLDSSGAMKLRAGLDQQIHESGEWLPQRDLGFPIYAQSRALLEHLMLDRTRSLVNVDILDAVKVEELLLDDQHNLRGVLYKDDQGLQHTLESDFVVDASGAAGVFVNKLSVNFPDISRADELASNIAYASVLLKKPTEWLDRVENVLLIPEPTHNAGGALLSIEGDQWIVSLHGRNGLVPPTDIDEWKTFARERLPATAIWDRVKDAEPVTGVVSFRKPKSTWRRFDLVDKLPQGYFPLGDTISSVNPIFGQGMTVAFGHALSLKQACDEQPDNPQPLYVKKAAAWSEKAWRRVAAYDATFSQQDEKQSRNYQIMRSLALARQKKAHEDPAIHEQLVRQAQMQI